MVCDVRNLDKVSQLRELEYFTDLLACRVVTFISQRKHAVLRN